MKTRREFLAGLAGATGLTAGAAGLRRGLGLRLGLGANRKPTARNYVQDGLIAMWDAVENAGWGVHDPNATVWKDLVGTRDAILNGGTWGDNVLNIGNNNAEFSSTLFNGWDGVTLEFVFETDFVNAGAYAATFTNTDDSYSFFRRNGNGWEIKTRTSGRPMITPFLGKPFHIRGPVDGRWYFGYSDLVSEFSDERMAFTETSSVWQIGGNSSAGISRFLGTNAKYYCLRIYTKALTAAEIAANYAIDKARFGLA